ncbi:MAG: methionine--tRNA ligase [Capsulimonadaceae bacterium]|nr:methionine--tRNA ligase [Capsulimonadaceae bacterium]
MSKSFYVTTPIYYVNGVPHVGSATTTLIVDAVIRYHKLRGEKTYFLTGTDEHAQKVADAAAKAGKTPQEFVDDISQRFVEAWKRLGAEYDRFIRTSEPQHKATTAEVFRRLQATGDIYQGTYEGWYSVADETFLRDSEVEDGKSKETGAKVERVTEINYYFRLSAYGDRLLAHIEANPDFLIPDTRRNEVIAFIKEGLRDVPVSRRNTGWGIPVPGDDSQVVYVWFDALINYLTASGWPSDGWEQLWPADAHLVGKEIYTRFHATLWPAMLMGLGLPLPGHVVGHGWWLVGGEKGSKSKGNIPAPQDVIDRIVKYSGAPVDMATDALRYYLLRDISFTGDAEFGFGQLAVRYNGELANNLGNLLNRALNMLHQYSAGIVPDRAAATASSEIVAAALHATAAVESALDGYNPGAALEAIAKFVAANNKAIDTAAPWKRAKEGNQEAIDQALYIALEALRVVSVLSAPFIPKAADEIRRQLGISAQPIRWSDASTWGLLAAGTQTLTASPVFPRYDAKKAAADEAAEAAPEKPAAQQVKKDTAIDTNLISIDDFAKVQLRIAEIKTAERVEGAKKLLRLTVDAGEGEPRQLVAGIAESYAPEDLPGRKVVIVANLQPATIRGVVSNGMIVAATDADGKAVLLAPDKPDLAPGSKIR